MESVQTLDQTLGGADLQRIEPPAPLQLDGLHRRALAAAGLQVLYVPVLVALEVVYAYGPLDPDSWTALLVELAVSMAGLIAFLYWFAGAYRFAQDVSAAPLESTPGWSVAMYFIPIANLFVPYQRMREVQEASSLSARGVGLEEAQDTRLISVWWVVWVLGSVAALILSGLAGASTGQEAWALTAATGAMSALSAVLTALVTIRIDQEQQAMGEYLLEQHPLAPEAEVDEGLWH